MGDRRHTSTHYEKELLELAKPIRIDYAEIDEEQKGFQILSRLPMVGRKTW